MATDLMRAIKARAWQYNQPRTDTSALALKLHRAADRVQMAESLSDAIEALCDTAVARAKYDGAWGIPVLAREQIIDLENAWMATMQERIGGVA